MTMVSSGQIQLAGGNGTRSVNVELGVGATSQADINLTDYRTLAGAPSGQIKLSDFYGKRNSKTISVTVGSSSVYHSYDGILGNQYYEYRGYDSGAYGSVSPSSVFGYTIEELYTLWLLPTSTYQLVIKLSTSGLSQSLFHSVVNSVWGTLLTSGVASFSNGSGSIWTWTLGVGTTWFSGSSPQSVIFHKTS